MRRTILSVIVACLAAAAVQAQPVRRVGFRGDPRIDWRDPDPDRAGEDCFGNCGAGCSDFPNPCFGPEQYWIQEMLDEPQFLGVDYGVIRECDVTTGTVYLQNAFRYIAPMRETYHGFRTAGCQLHDNTCGTGWGILGCPWSPLFSCTLGREERDWTYEIWEPGAWYEPGDVIEGGCDICPGGPPCLAN
jgi:hypothetical protein